MKTEILGVQVDTYKSDEVSLILKKQLETKNNFIVVTPNPEMVMIAYKDYEFKNILNKSDLVLPDGIGIVLASKLNKIKIAERVTGFDTTLNILKDEYKNKINVFLLGAGVGVSEKAAENIQKKYKNINVVGTQDGYFKENDTENIINRINSLEVDVLLIGLGMKKQENFAHKYKELLNVKITLCIGGTIDVLAGKVKRAPEIFIKLNLEWLYRILKEPKRIVRSLQLPVFVFIFLLHKITRK